MPPPITGRKVPFSPGILALAGAALLMLVGWSHFALLREGQARQELARRHFRLAVEHQAGQVGAALREIAARARTVAASAEVVAWLADPGEAVPAAAGERLAELLAADADALPGCDRVVLRTAPDRVLASLGPDGPQPPPPFMALPADSSQRRFGFTRRDDDILLAFSVPVPGAPGAELILVFPPGLEPLFGGPNPARGKLGTLALIQMDIGLVARNRDALQPFHFRTVLRGGPGQITEVKVRRDGGRSGQLLGLWLPVEGTPLTLACLAPARTVLGPFSRNLAAGSTLLSGGLLGVLLAAGWTLLRLHRRTALRNGELALAEKELREQLRNSEKEVSSHRRLATAFDSAGDAMAFIDSQGRFAYANRAFENLLGLPFRDLQGRRVADFAPPDEVERLGTFVTAHRDATWSRRIRCRHREGERLLLDLTVSPVMSGDGGEITHYFAIARSVGGKAELEERTVQARKIEAVARFAGSLAHEFNNLLQVILGYAGEMVESVASPDLRESLEQILAASRRGSGITARLIAFSRRQTVRRETACANTAVRAVASTLQQRLGLDVDLRLDLADPLWAAALDGARFGQALVLLAENACEGMPHGGLFTIATGNVEFAETCQTLVGPLPPGQYVRVRISDTGQGISPERLEHLFEPVFETPQNGEGVFLGLGLSMVHGIVAQHDGGIVVESSPGRGASFLIYLPRVRTGEETPAADPAANPAPPCGKGRVVLLAEDEESVRQVAVRLLAKAGFAVIEGKDGKDALAQFEAHRDRIDLVMLDLVMPELTGAEVAERIRRQAPDLPILFCSGYAQQQLPAGLSLPEDIPLLAKPYDPQCL
ncbi:MAG: response regulator, partial [Lentisphaeria bacterium]|nr:response regulator [Lentisphaeria bacterium]